MWGLNEIGFGILIFGLIALFGKKTFMKVFRDIFKTKHEVEQIIEEETIGKKV